ncbi:MAG: peptidoglycan-binding domain-containing protein [Reyranella sp.]|nr:peptidoglycan-binding domain-containing protein [Reyranella sp.]
MATASGNSEGTHKSVMPVVAYGVVLALLVVAGVVVFVAGSGGGGKAGAPAGDTSSRSTAAAAADIEAARTARALKLPPRPASSVGAPPEKAAPEKTETEAAAASAKPEPNPASSSSSSQAEPEKNPEPLKIETAKAEPGKMACKVDLTRWPTDKSDQAQAVQMLLRDLGYYRGTTNGTVGPQTRTAIREFQAAAGEGETGEIGEALFEALKKKCAASP